MKERGKVYCSECRYYHRKTPQNISIDQECHAPDNTRTSGVPGNWYKKETKTYSRKERPFIINENNDCKWYKGKKWGLQNIGKC